MRIAYDLDGVLANFADPWAARVTARTGILFPRACPQWPTLWDWDKSALRSHGYSDEEARNILSDIWDEVKEDPNFWGHLPAMWGTYSLLQELTDIARAGHQVYFITSRPGRWAKHQSEQWLRQSGFDAIPTVLISFDKGLLAEGLKLDIFVDDKPENVLDVAMARPSCKTFVLDWAYNRDHAELNHQIALGRITRITKARAPLDIIYQEDRKAA